MFKKQSNNNQNLWTLYRSLNTDPDDESKDL